MKKLWVLFFILWIVAAIVSSWIAPRMNWWFPDSTGPSEGVAQSPLGRQIDDLFYLILVITTAVFIITQAALCYAMWKGAGKSDDPEEKALFTHGSHNLEVIWTIVPAGILLFIALYQMDVWARYRVKSNFPQEAVAQPIAEVTARQFEWRIRYPAPDRRFSGQADIERWLKNPEPGDLYAVNDLRVPTHQPVMIHLRTEDVQHSFFIPRLRVKQDALPGSIIPVWFEADQESQYELTCAELCGWGHYKMGARVWAQPTEDYEAYLADLQEQQNDDGVPDEQQQEGAAVAVND